MFFKDIEVGDLVRNGDSYKTYKVVELVTAPHKWRAGETQPALKVETAYPQPGERKQTIVIKEENSFRWSHRRSAKHARNVAADNERCNEALKALPDLIKAVREAAVKATGHFSPNPAGHCARDIRDSMDAILKDIEDAQRRAGELSAWNMGDLR